jgi:flagellar biosynthesis chaperone FliJ
VVLAPEKIIEKIKLAWHKKQEEQKNYEILKSRHGTVIQNAKT